MKPGSFDPDTSRHMIGDERARVIETKARHDADSDTYAPPPEPDGRSYWGDRQRDFERSVYAAQWGKRHERNQRKAAAR